MTNYVRRSTTRPCSACRSCDFAGKRVVVYFYPADDTPGCTKEACQFTERNPAFEEAGIEVVGISPDDAASHQRFRQKYGLTVRLLTDATHEVMERYGAWGEKTLYGRKSTGVIRTTVLIGPDSIIKRVWRHVRAGWPRREGARRSRRLTPVLARGPDASARGPTPLPEHQPPLPEYQTPRRLLPG